MKKPAPRFSVVIPTRPPCDTLAATIRTCVTQDFPSAEFIVASNACTAEVNDVLGAFHDDRIVHIKTSRHLPMSDNWERALERATGEYVIFIGSDDALMPGALRGMDRLLRDEPTEALAWYRSRYTWPSFIDPEEANRLHCSRRLDRERKRSRDVLAECFRYEGDFFQLPSVYHGLVSRELIVRMMRRTGRFFCSKIPDLYAGVAVTSAVDSYVFSFRSFSLSGNSGNSTGHSLIRTDAANTPARRFLDEGGPAIHPKLRGISPLDFAILDCVLQARDRFPAAMEVPFSMKPFIRRAYRTAHLLTDASHRASVLEGVRATAELNGITEVDGSAPAAKAAEAKVVPPLLAVTMNGVSMRLRPDDVSDVFEAAQLAGAVARLADAGLFSGALGQSPLSSMRRKVRGLFRKRA